MLVFQIIYMTSSSRSLWFTVGYVLWIKCGEQRVWGFSGVPASYLSIGWSWTWPLTYGENFQVTTVSWLWTHPKKNFNSDYHTTLNKQCQCPGHELWEPKFSHDTCWEENTSRTLDTSPSLAPSSCLLLSIYWPQPIQTIC